MRSTSPRPESRSCPALVGLPVAFLAREGFGGSPGPELTRYLAVVALLVVAIGGVAWAFRRLMAGSLRLRAARRSLQVIDVLPLGGKRQLSIVRCYDRTFALGLGEKDVSLVAELDPVTTGEGERDTPTEDDFDRLIEVARARLERRRADGERVGEVVA